MSFPKRTIEPENVELKSYSTVELKPESNEENSAVAQQVKDRCGITTVYARCLYNISGMI